MARELIPPKIEVGHTLGTGELDDVGIKEDVHLLNAKNGVKPKAPQRMIQVFVMYALFLLWLGVSST